LRITQLNSASIIIEDRTDESKTKILCDPWLDGEEYLGSWAIYPPYEFVSEKFSDLDSHLRYNGVGSVYKRGLFFLLESFLCSMI